jgi:hypothetical protein
LIRHSATFKPQPHGQLCSLNILSAFCFWGSFNPAKSTPGKLVEVAHASWACGACAHALLELTTQNGIQHNSEARLERFILLL